MSPESSLHAFPTFATIKGVKYSWQVGPFPKAQSACNHRNSAWPHNDSWAVFECKDSRLVARLSCSPLPYQRGGVQ